MFGSLGFKASSHGEKLLKERHWKSTRDREGSVDMGEAMSILIWRDEGYRTRERGADGIHPSKSKGGSLYTRSLELLQIAHGKEHETRTASNQEVVIQESPTSTFTVEYLRTNEPIRGWTKGSQSQRGGQATSQGGAQVKQ